jgi:hypothetical protein
LKGLELGDGDQGGVGHGVAIMYLRHLKQRLQGLRVF